MENTELKNTRREGGFRQTKIAQEVGISVVSYQRIESGKQEPGVLKAIKIAEILGIQKFEDFKRLFGAATPRK